MNDTQPEYRSIRDLHWSHQEKKIARQAFDAALQREFGRIIKEVKNRAAVLQEPSQLWDLEAYLAAQGKRINQEYDYRYSMLIMVFGNLLRKGRLSEKDLEGLSEEKLTHIRNYAKLL